MIWAKESESSKKETVGLIWKSSPEKFPFVVLWNLRRGFCNWIMFAATGRLNFQWNSLLRSCAIYLEWSVARNTHFQNPFGIQVSIGKLFRSKIIDPCSEQSIRLYGKGWCFPHSTPLQLQGKGYNTTIPTLWLKGPLKASIVQPTSSLRWYRIFGIFSKSQNIQ